MYGSQTEGNCLLQSARIETQPVVQALHQVLRRDLGRGSGRRSAVTISPKL